MHGSALKPGKQDLALQTCLLFSKLFFQFLNQWPQLISWIVRVLSGRLNWVSAIWEKKKKMALYILKEFSLKCTKFFLDPLASEEIEHDLKRKTFIRKVWSHEKEQSEKHYVFLKVLYW